MRGCGDCFDDRQEPDHDLRTEERWHLRGRVQDADGEVLAISIPRTEANVIRHFQERMPYGLFVPGDAQCDTVAL